MAKEKSKKKKKGAAKAPKLPKQIAGVKVPKELREPGGKLLAAMSNPLVMDLAAAALVAAATGLRDRKAGPRATATPPPAPTGNRPEDLGALLALKAVEGVRRLGQNAARPRRGEDKGEQPKNQRPD